MPLILKIPIFIMVWLIIFLFIKDMVDNEKILKVAEFFLVIALIFFVILMTIAVLFSP